MTTEKRETTETAGLRRRRCADLLRAWHRVLADRYGDDGGICGAAIAARAVLEPAPEYYITLSRAERLLRQYRDNSLPPSTREMTWALAAELSRRVSEVLACGTVTTVTAALARVLVTGGASRFFITPRYAGRMVSDALRRRAVARRRALREAALRRRVQAACTPPDAALITHLY